MCRFIIVCCLVLISPAVMAHGFGGSGFLHPLTGLDHMIAMIAVGAWSAQIGGKAIWRVPLAFLLMMGLGGLAGISHLSLNFTEYGIALSVIMLGLAIAVNQQLSWFIAATAVGMFGFCHGYSHGAELPAQMHIAFYIIGFLITTMGLHIVGAIGGLLLVEEKQGQNGLRIMGAAAALAGIILFIRL